MGKEGGGGEERPKVMTRGGIKINLELHSLTHPTFSHDVQAGTPSNYTETHRSSYNTQTVAKKRA